ncbi:MAG TPA: periplasmic heavy metal sensor [Thermoanaerobaculia bacterium]|jgi:Spy/CpxP family protein refolding chaperone|nr:periplasmic heavy metal sensor [Thermoanaerobaculia bacterium]
MKRLHVVAAALVALVLMPALGHAAPRGGRATPEEILRNPRLLARYLNLTAAQVTQEEALFKTLNDSLRANHQQEETLRDQLQAELDKPSPDACTAGGYVVSLHGLYEQAEAAVHAFDTAFSAILTPEQLAKYNALKELAHGPGK